jgi:hypothetical protein
MNAYLFYPPIHPPVHRQRFPHIKKPHMKGEIGLSEMQELLPMSRIDNNAPNPSQYWPKKRKRNGKEKDPQPT